MTDTTQERDLVGLEPHTRASPETQPTARQLAGDVGRLDGQSGRKALDDDDEGAPVGLAGGQKAQHVATLPDASGAPGAPITLVTR